MARRLGEKQISEFKAAFLEQQKIILKKNKEKKQERRNEVDFDGDETDVVQGTLLSSIGETLSSRDTESLKNIQNALARIEAGTFGLCEECEGLIGKARLLARPEAELCITCAEKAEFESKHFLRNR
jgi:DnaK suppressor protein